MDLVISNRALLLMAVVCVAEIWLLNTATAAGVKAVGLLRGSAVA